MSQRSVEIVIGRLVTDEQFREAFRAGPSVAFEALAAGGLPLTPTEREALVLTPHAAWDTLADALDPRLCRVALPQDAPVS